MPREKDLLRSLELLKDIGVKTDSITAIKHIPAQEGRFREYSPEVHPNLVDAFKEKGFMKLYTHQHQSHEMLREGKNVVVVTPTASGKTLCYNLPVLDTILKTPSARAISVSDQSSFPGPKGGVGRNHKTAARGNPHLHL